MLENHVCPSCGNSRGGRVSECERQYPPALLKACYDPFDYALKLRTGEVIRFHEATIHGEYATLAADGTFNPTRMGMENPNCERLAYPCPRGVDVRIADIVWCADAPEGS